MCECLVPGAVPLIGPLLDKNIVLMSWLYVGYATYYVMMEDLKQSYFLKQVTWHFAHKGYFMRFVYGWLCSLLMILGFLGVHILDLCHMFYVHLSLGVYHPVLKWCCPHEIWVDTKSVETDLEFNFLFTDYKIMLDRILSFIQYSPDTLFLKQSVGLHLFFNFLLEKLEDQYHKSVQWILLIWFSSHPCRLIPLKSV
jgi:hypothetical protein